MRAIGDAALASCRPIKRATHGLCRILGFCKGCSKDPLPGLSVGRLSFLYRHVFPALLSRLRSVAVITRSCRPCANASCPHRWVPAHDAEARGTRQGSSGRCAILINDGGTRVAASRWSSERLVVSGGGHGKGRDIPRSGGCIHSIEELGDPERWAGRWDNVERVSCVIGESDRTCSISYSHSSLCCPAQLDHLCLCVDVPVQAVVVGTPMYEESLVRVHQGQNVVRCSIGIGDEVDHVLLLAQKEEPILGGAKSIAEGLVQD